MQRPQRFLLAVGLVILLVSTVLALGRTDTGTDQVVAPAAAMAPDDLTVQEPPPAPQPPPDPVPANPLQDEIAFHLQGRAACVVVREGGRTRAAIAADTPMIPASAQKVLVAAAALQTFGPDHRFRTQVVGAAGVLDGTVGDLWLVGGGDPLLATPEYISWLRENRRFDDLRPTSLAALADAVVGSGVHTVHGRVYADDTRHEPLRYLPSWKPSFLTGGSVTRLSALTVNRGFETWTPSRKALDDPPSHTAAQLTRLLRERGVTVIGEAALGQAPAETAHVADVVSAPLPDVLTGMLRSSDNVSAEMITREVGLRRTGSGSTAAGVDAVRDALREMGVDTAGMALVDGSGLDAGNRATCRTLVDTVEMAPAGVSLPQMLALAGRSGTLHHRLQGTPLEGRLYGKTGWINGVVALTGTVDVGRSFTFAVVQNGVPTLNAGRGVEEAVLATVAAHSAAP